MPHSLIRYKAGRNEFVPQDEKGLVGTEYWPEFATVTLHTADLDCSVTQLKQSSDLESKC